MMAQNCSDEDRAKTPSSTSPSESSSSSDDIPKIHSLVLVRNDQFLIGKRNRNNSGVTTLDLSQGENWLQLPHSTANDDLDDGSDIDSDLNDNIPTILSSTSYVSNNMNTTQPQEFWLLSATEPSVLDENLVGCFLCLDVDESYLTIKDMRTPQQHSEADDGSEWVVSIGRNGQKKNINNKNPKEIIVQERDDFRINSSVRHSAILPTQFNEETFLSTSSMEELPRRQLRILNHNDVIVLRRQKTHFEDNVTETKVLHKIILQCQYDVSIDRHRHESRRRVPESGLIELQNHDEESDRKISFSDANNMPKYGYIENEIKQLSKDDSLSLECESKDDDADDGVLDTKENTKSVSEVLNPPTQGIEKLAFKADNALLKPSRASALHVKGQLVVEAEERNENSGESSGSEGDRPTPYSTMCSSAAISSVDDETTNGGLGGLLTQPMSSENSHDNSDNNSKAVSERDVPCSDTDTNKLIVVEESKADIKIDEKEDDEDAGDDDSTIDPDDEPLETFAKRVSISSKLIRSSNSVSDNENHLEAHEDKKLNSASKLDTSDISRNANIDDVGSDATLVSNHIHDSNELNDKQRIENPNANLSSDVPTAATALGNQVTKQRDRVASTRDNDDLEESENMLAMPTPPSVKAKNRKSVTRNSSSIGNDPESEMYSECLLSQEAQLTPDVKRTLTYADISTKQEIKQQASLQNSSALNENTLEVSKCDIDCSQIANNQLQTDTDITELESTNAKDAETEVNLNIDEQLALESECSYFPLMTQAPESMQLEEDTNENSALNEIAVDGGTPSPLSEEIQVVSKITKTEQGAGCNDKDLERSTAESRISDPKASSFDEAKKEGTCCNDQPLDEGLVGQCIDQIETGSKLSKRVDFDVTQEDPKSSCTIPIVPVDPESATKMMISNETDGGHEVPSVSNAEAVNAALIVANTETETNSIVGLEHNGIVSAVEVPNRDIGVVDEPIVAVDLESGTKMMESISNETDGGQEVPSVYNADAVDEDAFIVDNAETDINSNLGLDHKGIVSTVEVSNREIGVLDEDSSRGHPMPISLEDNTKSSNFIAVERLDNETHVATESKGLTLDVLESGNQKLRENIPFQVLNTDYSIIDHSDNAGKTSHENCLPSIDSSSDIGMTVTPSSDKYDCVETHEARTDQNFILSALNHANESKENFIPHEIDGPSADIKINVDATVLSSSDIETHVMATDSEVKEISHENCIPSADSNSDIGVIVMTSTDKDEAHVARTDHSLLASAVNRTNDTEVKKDNNITPKNVKALAKKVHKRKAIASDGDVNILDSVVSSSSVLKRNKRSTRVVSSSIHILAKLVLLDFSIPYGFV